MTEWEKMIRFLASEPSDEEYNDKFTEFGIELPMDSYSETPIYDWAGQDLLHRFEGVGIMAKYIIDYDFESVWGYDSGTWDCEATDEDDADAQFANYIASSDDDNYTNIEIRLADQECEG